MVFEAKMYVVLTAGVRQTGFTLHSQEDNSHSLRLVASPLRYGRSRPHNLQGSSSSIRAWLFPQFNLANRCGGRVDLLLVSRLGI